jgi:hypothetical protein
MTALTAMHSAVFGAWLALFLGQTMLVGRGWIATHRRLGFAAMTLAALMIVVGYATAIATGRRGFDLSGDLNVAADPLAYLVFPLGDLVSFAVFVMAAFWYRRQPAIHKRLMVFATAGSLMGAPLAHLIGHHQALRDIPGPVILLPLALLYFANAIHDRLTLGRIHRWSLWGGVALFVWANVRAAVIAPSAAWHRVAAWLLGPALFVFASVAVTHAVSQTVLFEDSFSGKLGDGWTWVREHRDAWRVSPRGLEVRVEPGNMWGKANNAKNVLVRPEITITVRVENRPTAQYEQVDLVWYYDDSHMVKIGQELVDGQLSIVMGREEGDRPRTIRIVPLEAFAVDLRFLVREKAIRGQFRPVGSEVWQDVGETDLPGPPGGRPHLSLQFYQGPADAEHWARVSGFRVERR